MKVSKKIKIYLSLNIQWVTAMLGMYILLILWFFVNDLQTDLGRDLYIDLISNVTQIFMISIIVGIGISSIIYILKRMSIINSEYYAGENK